MSFLFMASILMVSVLKSKSEPCLQYGCPFLPTINEPFLPAPPGRTPSCARPGQTFCEVLDNYPQRLIKLLIEKCAFDLKTIFKVESSDDFRTYKFSSEFPNQNRGYEYPKPAVPQFHTQPVTYFYPQFSVRQPALIYNPPLNGTYGRRVQQSQFNDKPIFIDIKHQTNPHLHHQQPQSIYPLSTDQNLWKKRFVRRNDLGISSKTSMKNPLLGFIKRNNGRSKRQSPEAIQICPTRPQFVAPRAGLNAKGNWMFVVNINEAEIKYPQIIRSEVCETDTCNGLCSIPSGYSSKCVQKHVQKKLLALKEDGKSLYVDVFWLPHGCMCEVTPEF